jgi:pterin-4a-carbinolamine dehydratase
MKTRSQIVAVTLLVAFASSMAPAHAYSKVSPCSQNQKQAVIKHITKQIDAITKNDWKRAYSYSSLAFQKAVSIEVFKATIKSQYVFLSFNDGLGFGACVSDKASISQLVTVDYRGVKRTLSYGLSIVNKRLGVDSANEIKSLDGANA